MPRIHRQEDNLCHVQTTPPQINNYVKNKNTTRDIGFWVDMCDKQQAEMEGLEDSESRAKDWAKFWENMFNQQQAILDQFEDDLKAMENRCKVAEDLNKVYVRMYLEMQMKHDHLAKMCCDCNENLN